MQQQQKLGSFVYKLQYLLQDQFHDIIRWDKTRVMIDIVDPEKMESDVIPRFFRHQKYQSFVRQLNLHGFKKIKQHGCQRFTHVKLRQGLRITSITSNKNIKRENNFYRDSISSQIRPIRTQQNPISPKNQIVPSGNINDIAEQRITTQYRPPEPTNYIQNHPVYPNMPIQFVPSFPMGAVPTISWGGVYLMPTTPSIGQFFFINPTSNAGSTTLSHPQ